MKKLLATFLMAIASLAVAAPPQGEIKIIVGQAPGGGNEFAWRAVAPAIERSAPGIKFLIEHRPGMDNVVAMNHFTGQAADGRSLLVTAPETSYISSWIAHRDHVRVDPRRYVTVGTIARTPLAIIVPANSPIRSMEDLIQQLRRPKGPVNIGINGGTNLLVYRMLIEKTQADSTVKSVNYNSPVAATTAVAAGDLDAAIVSIATPKPFIDGGRVRMLAHTGDRVIAGLESVPQAQNSVPGLIMHVTWTAFLPPGTDNSMRDWYAKALQQALKDPATVAYFEKNWAQVIPELQTPQGAEQNIRDLEHRWMGVAQSLNR